MHRSALLIVLAGALIASTGCRYAVSETRHDEVREGALMKRTLREYRLVYSEYDGKVGYMKEYDVQDAGKASYRWKFVYDLDWKEVGFLDQHGNAYKYHYYGEFQQSMHKASFRQDRLTRDSMSQNVMRMLGIDPSGDNVSFPEATHEDIAGPADGSASSGNSTRPIRPHPVSMGPAPRTGAGPFDSPGGGPHGPSVPFRCQVPGDRHVVPGAKGRESPGRGPSAPSSSREVCRPRTRDHAPPPTSPAGPTPRAPLVAPGGRTHGSAEGHIGEVDFSDRRKRNLTETVRAWREYAPEVLPLPHPSPRNNRWLARSPWFAAEVLPSLRARVAAALAPPPPGG